MTPPITIGVASVKQWKKIEGLDKCNSCRDNGIKDSFFRPSYYGGCVDNFRLYSEDAYYFDENSEYPHVCVKYNFPVGISYLVEPKNFKFDDYEFYICNCDVDIPKNLYVSPFPYRSPSTGSLIFPVGKIKNVFLNSIDVGMILKVGGTVKINKVFVWDKSDNLFAKYMNHYYDLKRSAVDKDGVIINSGQYQVAKLMMNSLTGKLGQKPERSFYINDTPENDIKNSKYFLDSKFQVTPTEFENYSIVTTKKIQSYTTTHIIGFITSYARRDLFNTVYHVLDKDYNVFYCDTDSLITDFKLKSHPSKLGEWKLEDKITRGYYPSPKLYGYITDDGREIIKCKGLNYDDVSITKLRQILQKDREIESHKIGVSKFASILKGYRKPLECYDLCRFAKRNDNKRIESNDYKMLPICY